MSKLKNPRAVTLPYGDFYAKVSAVNQLTYLVSCAKVWLLVRFQFLN